MDQGAVIGALVRFRPEAVKKWVEEQEVAFFDEERQRMERVAERILARAERYRSREPSPKVATRGRKSRKRDP